jgi:hypothetical protein
MPWQRPERADPRRVHSLDGLFLDTALSIGLRLASRAIWQRNACTWEIVTTDRRSPNSPQPLTVAASAGLYQGSSGIALFLSELYRLTLDPRILHAADAGFRHAAAVAQQWRSDSLGFHTGRVGVAFALARHADLTKESEFDTLSLAVLIGGGAGAIPALLRLARRSDCDEARELAINLGNRLVQRAERGVKGWSWHAAGMHAVRNLTGYAHGTAGFAHALAELYADTGDGSFLYAVEQAVEYDHSAFLAANGFWPDFRHMRLEEVARSSDTLRELQTKLRAGGSAPAYQTQQMVAWCHGAPGIGLARLRTYELTGDAQCLEDVISAADITARFVEDQPQGYSLCHGALGNCELLVGGARQLDRPRWEEIALSCAEKAALEYERPGKSWPSGAIFGRPDPSLLLGDAGIGHFYLRLADPAVPSVLLVEGADGPPHSPRMDGYDAVREEHVNSYFGATRAVVDRFLPGELGGPQTRQPVAEMAERLHKLIGSGGAAGIALSPDRRLQAQLADAARLDFARYELDAESTDFTVEYLDALAYPPANEIPWETVLPTLAKGVRLLATEFDWDVWSHGSPPPQSDVQFLVYRRRRRVHIRRVGNFAAFIFSRLTRPTSLDELVAAVVNEGAFDGTAIDEVRARIRTQVKRAYEAALITFDLRAVTRVADK